VAPFADYVWLYKKGTREMIPEQTVYEFYMAKATTPISNRFHNYLKKFRKIEQFIKDYNSK